MEKNYPLVWVAFIICIFLVWFFSHRAKHKERLMMIEKGLNVGEHLQKQESFRFPWLKLGIVVIGLSIGLLIIAILVGFKLLERGGNTLPLSILGVCGGISMVIANYVKNGKSK